MTKAPTQILGIGTDIIEIERIAMAIQRHGSHFLDRIFTANEQKYAQKFSTSEVTLAGRFAAKEAVAKALGTGINRDVSWLDIEIINDASGKPALVPSPRLQAYLQNNEVLVSISHCKQYATAFAIVQASIS